MNSKVYFATLLIFAFAAPYIFAAGHEADRGLQLWKSIALRNVVAARNLIQTGANVNYRPKSGTTSLMMAAFINGDVGLIRMMIARGADTRAVSDRGWQVLHFLVGGRSTPENFRSAADMLLAAGANINAQDEMGNTPLHLAARNGLYLRAQYLLRKGANAGIKNKEGKYPVDLVPHENRLVRELLLNATHAPQIIK